MKILFLGERMSRLSAECLDALLQAHCGEVTVGVGALTFRRWRRRAAGGIRRHGLCGALVSSLRWRLGHRRRKGLSLRDVLAAHRGIRYFTARNINTNESVARVRALAPEVILVAAFRQILKLAVIELPRLGCINVHPSLLPRYRGPAPFYWVLKNRESTTGVTIHYMDEGVDTGDIIAQEAFEIDAGDDERSLRAKSAAIGARLLVETVQRLAAGEKLPRRAQDHAQATYFTLP